MREIKLSEWKKIRAQQEKFKARPRKGFKRSRPSTSGALSNSIKYIKAKKESLEREKILYPVSPRVWRMRVSA